MPVCKKRMRVPASGIDYQAGFERCIKGRNLFLEFLAQGSDVGLRVQRADRYVIERGP